MRSSLLGVQLESEVPVPRLWQGNLFGREFVLNKIISWELGSCVEPHFGQLWTTWGVANIPSNIIHRIFIK